MLLLIVKPSDNHQGINDFLLLDDSANPIL
jgi:hypothetical protein